MYTHFETIFRVYLVAMRFAFLALTHSVFGQKRKGPARPKTAKPVFVSEAEAEPEEEAHSRAILTWRASTPSKRS